MQLFGNEISTKNYFDFGFIHATLGKLKYLPRTFMVCISLCIVKEKLYNGTVYTTINSEIDKIDTTVSTFIFIGGATCLNPFPGPSSGVRNY
jgi:hypothetical protein